MSTQQAQPSRRNPIIRAARSFFGVFWSGFNIMLNTAGFFIAVALILSLAAGYLFFIAPATGDTRSIGETLAVLSLISTFSALLCISLG